MLMYRKSSKRSKTNFTQHILHWGSFPLCRSLWNSWGSATTTFDESAYQTNSNNYCRFKMKWTSMNFFYVFFTVKFKAIIYAIQTWEIFQLNTCVCYLWKYTILRWNLSSRLSGTRFKFLNIVSKSMNH